MSVMAHQNGGTLMTECVVLCAPPLLEREKQQGGGGRSWHNFDS